MLMRVNVRFRSLEARMAAKPVIAIAMFCGLCLSARADDAAPTPSDATASPKLPTFALNPQPLPSSSQSPSPWTGFYVGSEVFAISGKGVKGAVGGGAYAGYNREFDNNLVLGVEASTGFTPSSFRHGPFVGYDFAATNVKLGYDMGRLMPFVTAGFAFAKPDTRSGGFQGASDSVNDLFGSPSNLRVLGTVGAGFDYQLTHNLSVGLAVSAGTGHGPPAP
jgi:opacity protein-like surface antigen